MSEFKKAFMKVALGLKDTSIEFARSAETFSKDLAKAISTGIKNGKLSGVQMLNDTVNMMEHVTRQPVPAIVKVTR